MRDQGQNLHIFESPSAAQRLGVAANFLRGLPSGGRVLIVGPSSAAVSHLLARVLAPGSAMIGAKRHTLLSLASALAADSLAATERCAATSLSSVAVCMRVVAGLLHENKLGRFREVATRPGFARALSSSLQELRAASVSPGELAGKDPDLAVLYARYVSTLEGLKLADSAHLFELACERLRAHRHEFCGLPSLWLDVRVVCQSEAQLLSALVARGGPHLVTLPHGDERTMNHLCLSVPHVQVERSKLPVNDDLDLLKVQLFQASASGDFQNVERGRVQLLSAPGESREAVELVRRVLAYAARGTAFDQMAILLRAPSSYRAVLAEAFARGRVPAHFAAGVQRPNPAGRALLSLLACADENLSARAFADYLSIGATPRVCGDESSDRTRLAPRHFERLLMDAAVVGGASRWARRLSGLGAALSSELEGLEPDDPRRSVLERDVRGLSELQAFALPILDALTALPHGGTWADWIEALTALSRLAIRDSEGLSELIAELSPLSTVGPVRLSDVRRLLAGRVGDVLVRDKGTGAGKVFVGTIEDALGRTFEHVFVPGLAENIFPPRILEDPVLPDAVRAGLSSDLVTTDQRARDERLFLHVAVGAATEGLVLSYPRFDVGHGRPRVPSFYGLEVLRAVDGKLSAFDELARRADGGAAPRMGFPAPDDARQAIDSAEFDLATLQTLLRAGPEVKRHGAARYLLSESATLARALRFRARRWTVPRFTPADGLVASEGGSARDDLAVHRFAARAYSATALATFADCPYKFFLHAVVGLAPRRTLAEVDTIDDVQRGILFHAVQRATLEEWRSEQLLPPVTGQYEAAQAIMQRVLLAEGARLRERCCPAIESVFADTLSGVAHDLGQWLARLWAEKRFAPAYFELAFGLPPSSDRDSASQTEPVELPGGLRLRGSIDLVERAHGEDGAFAPDGPHRPTLRATDHKTGRSPERALGIVNGGKTLQPVLYALALEAMFSEATVRSGRLYFCTSGAGFTEHEVMLSPQARAAARDLADTINRALEQAFLPAAPSPKACQTCPYQAICGPYEEERVARHKDQRALKSLYYLRSLP